MKDREWTKLCLENCQSSKMELFAKIVNNFQMLLIIMDTFKGQDNDVLRELKKFGVTVAVPLNLTDIS